MYSTKTTVESFFPDLAIALQHYFPSIYALLLPEHISQQCSHIEYELIPGITMVSPMLGVVCILGALVGILGYFALSRRPTCHFSWSIAFLFFGCMNIDGLILHCFLLDKTSSMARLFHCMDIMFTSLSSANMILATIDDCNVLSTSNDANATLSSRLRKHRGFFFNVTSNHCAATIVVIAILAVLGEYIPIPFTGEVLYIGVTAVAAGFSGIVFIGIPLRQLILEGMSIPSGFEGLLVAVVGVIMFVQASIIETVICDYSPLTWVRAHITGVPIAFFGCVVGFVGLFAFLNARPPITSHIGTKTD